MDRVAPEHRNALTVSIANYLRQTRKAGVVYMQEIWKDIPDYEGLYQISNLGNVKSLSFGNLNSEKLLKSSPTNCGYYKVQLYKNHHAKMHYVHRLVASSFIPNPNNKPQINHIDGDKSNNRALNLEWVSAKENTKHATNIGLRKPPMAGRTGANNPNSKPILQYSLSGIFVAEWSSTAEASRALSIPKHAISCCLCGKNKSGYNYMWFKKTSDLYPLRIAPITYSHERSPMKKGITRNRTMNKIRQLDKSGNLIRVWDNYKQLQDETGYDNGNIYKAINGKAKSAYGFRWEYE